ncbi:placenta-specific gene 8 protein-like [Megalobrama amblycephala]|uniref:placenta-specific gene 8 protein-like n=1 Tax=Megalobrama amblycephala TaxID=75352 RepID=UPI002013DBA1|nr:placenta-specific gene 8 protein-like [Megalobrama amblycephala]
MEVTSQPAAFEPQEFQTGLLGCCEDVSICCCGLFCLPCLGCSIASDMKECCLCGLGMTIRSVYRTKYNIPGSLCEDWLVSYCCFTCSACQLKRDLTIRIHNGTLKP